MPNTVKTHKDLDVWQRSVRMVTNIYKLTSTFPKSEMFGLSTQLRRTAVSIPSNISEGSGRSSSKELTQFLYIALGSLSELETQLIIAKNLEFLKSDEIFNDLTIIRKQLLSLIKSIKRYV